MKLRLSAGIRESLAGWQVLSAYQIPQDDGRKLKRCVEPADPWRVTLYDGPSVLAANRHATGAGLTLEEAILDAIPDTGQTRRSVTRLETAMGHLAATIRVSRFHG